MSVVNCKVCLKTLDPHDCVILQGKGDKVYYIGPECLTEVTEYYDEAMEVQDAKIRKLERELSDAQTQIKTLRQAAKT